MMADIIVEHKMRDTVEVIMSDGTVLSGPRHASVGEFMRKYQDPHKPLIVGAIVNNDLRELTFPISADARVTPLDMTDSDGARIYRRSLTFLIGSCLSRVVP
jgi:uridine kinase